MSNLRKLIIDGDELEISGDLTLIQACEQVGIEIPRFCYHERLSIAGNCRMCLVEVVGGSSKPVASCAMQVKDLQPGTDGQPPVVKTRSPMAKKARQGVMEFLLLNHPLDCPICDQGGECDLQDQAMAYGVEFSRYQEAKRAVDDLDLGPLVETHMTRCISCTRCVRFTTEVAGITQMGQTGRGEDAEITSYLNQTLVSNLQGNIIDLCPVGALTSKPYAFTARPWELTKTETIDVMDALGSNIRVDCKGREVMRILPRNHDDINQEWISDKTRFVWDGLRNQRLDRPYVRENGQLIEVSWDTALKAAANAMNNRKLTALAGDLVPVEAVFALGKIIDDLGGKKECRIYGEFLPAGNRSGYVGNSTIDSIDNAERIVLIGTNPRNEMPVLNARIRAAWLAGASIATLGPKADLTYEHKCLGNDLESLRTFSNATKDEELSGMLILVGMGALIGEQSAETLAIVLDMASRGAGFLILHLAASRAGAMDVGFTCEGGIENALQDVETIYCLGVDEIDIEPGPIVIYQGSHGDRGAHRADIILPSAAYTEETGIFVNTEGRPQLAMQALFPPGSAKENWAIIRAFSAFLNKLLPCDSIVGLRQILREKFPHLLQYDAVPGNELHQITARNGKNKQFSHAVDEFYLTNPIARASRTMGELATINSNRNQHVSKAA